MSEPVYLPKIDDFKRQTNKLMKDYGITHKMLAVPLDMPREEVGRMIGAKNVKRIRVLTYEDAQIIVDLIMKVISPFPKTTINRIKTGNKKVKKFGTVKLTDKVSLASETMTKKGYTQLLVTNDSGKFVGLLTDSALINRMLHPQEKRSDWLKTFREQTIEQSQLLEEVPVFTKDDNPVEIAQSLTYHYAVLINEGDGNFGMVTRNDLVKVLNQSFTLP